MIQTKPSKRAEIGLVFSSQDRTLGRSLPLTRMLQQYKNVKIAQYFLFKGLYELF